MARLDKLIEELCPHGVEYKRIEQLISKNPFKQLGAKELENLKVEKGNIKLLPSSQNYDWWTNEEVAKKNNICEGEVISLGRARYANIKYHKGKFISSNNHLITSIDEKVVLNRYLFHFISSNLSKFYVDTSTYPKLDSNIFITI